MKVLGLDPGFGDIKYSYRNENGEIINKKFSSVVAKASDKAVDMPLLEGERYYIGRTALLRSSSDVIDLFDYEKLEKVMPLFLYEVLNKLNLKPEDIDVIGTGLSFAHIEHSGSFKKRLSRFKINGQIYDFKDKIALLPQGVGAKYAIEYFLENVPDVYMIVDIGTSTIDTVDVIEGVVRPENIHGFKDEGVIRILRNIQHIIGKNFSEQISLKEAKEVLETGNYFLEGEDHDLTKEIEELKTNYTKITLSTLKERFSREFKKYRKIYFVGGGAYYIDSSVSKIIEVLDNPEFYNSIGNLLKAEEVFKNKK